MTSEANPKTEPDERLGKVSASRFEILALCAGSEQLRRSLPPEALDTGDEYTALGTKLHAAWETDQTLGLTEDELEIYTRGVKSRERAVEEWKRDFNITDYRELEREQRFYLNDPDTGQVVTSAKLDHHFLSADGKYCLIVDSKGLWCSNLTPAIRNYQGRVQAVLAAREYDVPNVRVVFNKAMFGSIDAVDYNRQALTFSEQSIYYSLWESEQPGAPIRPGDHCTYCPCKAYCKDGVNYAQLPAVQRPGALKQTLELIKEAAPEELLKVWRRESEITKIFKAIDDRLRELPPEEKERLGLAMKDGRSNDSLTDIPGFVEKLRAEGYTDEQIFSCMSASKAGVMAIVQDKLNCRKAEAEAFWETTLDPFITRAKCKASLVEK